MARLHAWHTRNQAETTHVDAFVGRNADAGSIPAASTILPSKTSPDPSGRIDELGAADPGRDAVAPSAAERKTGTRSRSIVDARGSRPCTLRQLEARTSRDSVHLADPPILLHDVFPDLDEVVRLLERGAPYTPLGGWMRPGLDPDPDPEAETSAMWFQEDWVHADYKLDGSELFLNNEKYIETAKGFWKAEEIVPHSVYTNLIIGLNECGPAHTDNPKFRGRERKNTPMWLLRLMLWSGLFARWEITQATAIWWMNDVDEGGGIAYWPEGPEKQPLRHETRMANTALVGDNHHMFHQVLPVGPFDRDLDARGEKLRFDLERFEDPALREALSLIYPDPVPVGAQPSIYDYA